MNRVVQTVLGILLLVVAAVLALGTVTSKGSVVLAWPLASIILTFAVVGGFFVSKSLMTDAIKTVAGAVRRAKPTTP